MNMLKTILSPYPQNSDVSLDGSVLSFRSWLETKPADAISVDLSVVVAEISQDHGVITVGSKNGSLFAVQTTEYSVNVKGANQASSDGVVRQDTPIAVFRSLGGQGYPGVVVLTPYRGCSLNECSLYFFDSSGTAEYPATDSSPACVYGSVSLTQDGAPLVASVVGLLPQYLATWLPISFSGGTQIPAGGTLSLTVVAPDGPEVYLEAMAGSLSRSRARNGDIVTLNAIELAPGTRIRIKAGYKYWPGKSDFFVDVV